MSTQLISSKGKGKRTAARELEVEVQEKLRECERRIDAAQIDAWDALRKIHDEKLYKVDGYTAFKDYVEQRWGMSKSHAHRLIDHSKIIEYLKDEGVGFLPGGEGLTRPLTKFRRTAKSEDDFLQKASEAWRASSDSAPKAFDVPQVTVQHVESTMERLNLFRNAKRASVDAALTALHAAITKLSQCDALAEIPQEFAAAHPSKTYPSKFYETATWLVAYAEACGGES